MLKGSEAQAAKASHEETGRPTEQSAQDTENPAQAATGSAADDEGSLVAEMLKVDWKVSMTSCSLPRTCFQQGYHP